MIRVLIVDDDAMVRGALQDLIGTAGDLQVAGVVQDGDQVLAAVRTAQPHVVLMDVRMTRQDGLTTAAALRTLPGAPKVLILTTFNTDDIVVRAASVADGFLLKTAEPRRMLDAIRSVARGDGVLDDASVQTLLRQIRTNHETRGAAREALAALTEREVACVVGAAGGATNEQIGAQLFIAPATVKTHLGSAQAKLGVRGRVELAVLAARAGLV